MAKQRFGIWSPHRDSDCVTAYMALMKLRAERWVWCERPAQASWWVVDGTRADLDAVTRDLKLQQANHDTLGAYLANDWLSVPDPAWTFFKTPLQNQQVFRWIDAALPKLAQRAATWHGCRFRLRRWPNLAKYASHTDIGDRLKMTMACANLLEDWVSYEALIPRFRDTDLLHSILDDADTDSILEIAEPSFYLPPPPPAERSTGGWNIFKSLLRRFA